MSEYDDLIDGPTWKGEALAKNLPKPFIEALEKTAELAEPEKEEVVRAVKPGRCPMDAPAAARCKFCGKVHPL